MGTSNRLSGIGAGDSQASRRSSVRAASPSCSKLVSQVIAKLAGYWVRRGSFQASTWARRCCHSLR